MRLQELQDNNGRITALPPLYDFGSSPRGPDSGHGSAVAALAGGNLIGIAWMADLRLFNGRAAYRPDPRREAECLLNFDHVLHGILAVVDDVKRSKGAKDHSILNMSWNVPRRTAPEAWGNRLCEF